MNSWTVHTWTQYLFWPLGNRLVRCKRFHSSFYLDFLWYFIFFFHNFRKMIRVYLFCPNLTRRELKLFVHVHLKPWRKRLGTSRKRYLTNNPLNGQIDLFSHKTKFQKLWKNWIIREIPIEMKNKNVYIEPDGYQEVRERYTVHVSTVQENIFHFRLYLLFEIQIVFDLLG